MKNLFSSLRLLSLALRTMLTALYLFSLSCKQEQISPFEIDPRNFVDGKITLSEIADDITYTPLDNSFPIGSVYSMRVIDKSIYLSIQYTGIIQFDSNGRFVRKIGSQGRGPGEYKYGMQFAVDELTRNVFVADYEKIMVYSPSGRFLRDIPYGRYIEGDGTAQGIEVYNSQLFIPDFNIRGNANYDWVFLDTLGKLVSKKENSVPKFQTRFTGDGNIYRFEDKLCYYNYANDTIFTIFSDLSYKGVYLFAKGDFRWPQSEIILSSESQYIALAHKLFWFWDTFETNRYIVSNYSYEGKSAISFIDKKAEKAFLTHINEEDTKLRIYRETRPFLINDLDGGMPLSEDVKYLSVNNQGYLAVLINSLDLKVYVSSAEFKSIVPKYPDKKELLEKLAVSLKETDNPVIVMIRLKE